jgi:hypothetical protein
MSRPCPDCGGHRWAAAGYCLEIPCAGHYTDPDYPKNAPEELKWNRPSQPKSASKPKPKAPPKPPKKGRRALELQYEARGEIAPWLVEQKPEGS